MAKILVIDDEYLVRYTLARILRREGHEVTTAADGERGIAAFDLIAPEIVLADLVMPEPECGSPIRAMRRARPTTKIIAIMHRCDPDASDALTVARQLGADDVIVRPFDNEELLRHLDLALGERSPALA